MHKKEILKKLALIGAINKYITISATEFSQYTSLGPKTISRFLKKLEEEGYIKRQMTSGGQKIKFLDKGVELLEKEYIDYQKIFECTEYIELEGSVVSGIGEGQYYISQPEYMSQFIKKLNFEPYPGTLNVKLDNSNITIKQQLSHCEEIIIDGFTKEGRTFGSVKCYLIKMNGVKCAIIIPERSHYPSDLLEIISPINLRKEFELKDKDNVKILVEKHKNM